MVELSNRKILSLTPSEAELLNAAMLLNGVVKRPLPPPGALLLMNQIMPETTRLTVAVEGVLKPLSTV